MLISCKCGKKLNVRDELAGKKVKCPACGAVVLAAAPEQPRPAPHASPPPAALPAAVDDTAPPACWDCRRDFTDGLLILTDDALWFGKLEGKELKRAKKALVEGAAPADVLEVEATRWQLHFGDLKGVNFNKRHAQMELAYPGDKEDQTSTFHFADHATRDDAFKDLRRRLGTGWEFRRRDLNRFQAALAPLLTIGAMVLIFGFFVFLAWAIQQPAEGGRRVRTNIWGLIAAYTVGWLGPLWTGAIGGLCVVLAVAWMVVRIADPPIEITLKPKPGTADDEDEEQEQEKPREKRRRRSRDDDDD